MKKNEIKTVIQKNPNNISEQTLFEKKHKQMHHFILFMRIFILVFLLFLWEYSANNDILDPFFFSSPSRLLVYFKVLYKEENLTHHIMITLFETLLSFFLVLSISMIIACILWYNKTLSSIMEPYLVVLNSLPKSALAPLLIVWLGTGIKTIIIAGISVAIFGSIISLFVAFSQTETEKMKLIQTLGGSKLQQLFYVVLPFNIPIIISTMKVNIGLSLVGVIIGEFLSAREGLGYLIIYGTQVFKMPMVITSITILCIIAGILYAILQRLEHNYKKNL